MVFGLRVPGFLRVHWRYARRNFITWFVLFIAPFVIGVTSLSLIFERLLKVETSQWQLYLLALFFIALSFYFAERHREFRRIYVFAIPVLVVCNGLVKLLFSGTITQGSLIAFAILTLLPAWWLGKHATDQGYRLLSDGAEKDYRPGRDLYMDGYFSEAFEYLEPAAKRGHMKSLYLIGDSYEKGHGRDIDRVLAARFYDKASRKGYRKAGAAYDVLIKDLTPAEMQAFEASVGLSGLDELF